MQSDRSEALPRLRADAVSPASTRERTRIARLRRTASRRRFLSAALLIAPVLLVLSLDAALRGSRFSQFSAAEWQSYTGALLLGAALWAVLLFAAARRRGALAMLWAACFVFFLTIALGGQAYFFQQYSAYLNIDISRFATDFTESVVNQLVSDAGNYLSFKVPAFLLAMGLFFGARKWVRPRRKTGQVAGLLALPVLLASLFVPMAYKHRQPATPDILYMNAIGSMLKTQLGLSKESHQMRPRMRKSAALPRLLATPKKKRNVVFVILESVRKDATCNEYDPMCQRTAVTNQLFPGRTPLNQMRALDSSTAISMAVLWAGIGPNESREVMHTWPLLFDYAREAGYFTGYWTSQSMMFGNMQLWLRNLGVQSFFTATDVDPASDIDLGAPEDLFTERAVREISALSEPFFLTIQLSNGHYPYLVKEDGPQPFQPASTSKAPSENQAFFNHYQNAIHQQDRHLAKLLGALRSRPEFQDTVIVYTSDHGEAFREHGQMGHTFSLFDEEILVPAWIDAPEGTLTSEEREHLEAKRDAFTFHPDLTATILDLLGVWDDPALLRFKKKMLGVSLLRKPVNERALPLTNCAAVWSCAFENWGMMRGEMKLEARAWDHKYQCWDVRLDARESVNLGEAACGDLKAQADKTFGRLPGKGN